MKYFEYVYLVLSVMCLIFLATEFDTLTTKTIVYVLIAMAIFSFMYTFRRYQRKKVERFLEEKMKHLEEDDEKEEETNS